MSLKCLKAPKKLYSLLLWSLQLYVVLKIQHLPLYFELNETSWQPWELITYDIRGDI